MEKKNSLKSLSKRVRRRRQISLTVAFYRHKDSRRYAACGPIDAAASRHVTRVNQIISEQRRSCVVTPPRVIIRHVEQFI